MGVLPLFAPLMCAHLLCLGGPTAGNGTAADHASATPSRKSRREMPSFMDFCILARQLTRCLPRGRAAWSKRVIGKSRAPSLASHWECDPAMSASTRSAPSPWRAHLPHLECARHARHTHHVLGHLFPQAGVHAGERDGELFSSAAPGQHGVGYYVTIPDGPHPADGGTDMSARVG